MAKSATQSISLLQPLELCLPQVMDERPNYHSKSHTSSNIASFGDPFNERAFYRAMLCLARALLSQGVCRSVRLSVTRVDPGPD